MQLSILRSLAVTLHYARQRQAFSMSKPRTIRLSPEDNVVVAVDQIAVGANVAGVTARERVPRGHKLAIKAIGKASRSGNTDK